MPKTPTRQAAAENFLSRTSQPRTQSGAVPNAERVSKVHSFTFPPATDQALQKLTQIYDGMNASQIVARALAEMLQRAGGAPGAPEIEPDDAGGRALASTLPVGSGSRRGGV